MIILWKVKGIDLISNILRDLRKINSNLHHNEADMMYCYLIPLPIQI